MMTATKPYDPAKLVTSKHELLELLRAGLDSGEPKPVTDEDWQALRRRATIRSAEFKNPS